MATTIQELEKLLEQMKVRYQRRSDTTLVAGFETRNYRNPSDDANRIILVFELSESGEYFKLFAPMAYKATGPHTAVFLRACLQIQWRTKLLQFELDADDGEIRPIIEFPLEDARLTRAQLERCVRGMLSLLDDHHAVLKRALDEGVLELPAPGSRALEGDFERFVVAEMVRKLRASEDPKDRARADQIEAAFAARR